MTIGTEFPPDLRTDLTRLNNKASMESFNRSGCLLISNFLEETKVTELAETFSNIFKDKIKSGDTVKVGHKRHMISVPVEGEFSDVAIFAPKALLSFLSQTLGDRFLLSCFTCVTALPNAKSQHLHRDYWPLFDRKIDHFIPSYGINLFIPLTELTTSTGTTRMWPYSHRDPSIECDPDADGGVYPYIPLGSAILMDYGVAHAGTPNLSRFNRPILCIAFTREWFLDMQNFQNTNPLIVSDESLSKMKPQHQALFARSKLYGNDKT